MIADASIEQVIALTANQNTITVKGNQSIIAITANQNTIVPISKSIPLVPVKLELIRKENLKNTQFIGGHDFQRINAFLAQIPETLTGQRLYSSLQISS